MYFVEGERDKQNDVSNVRRLFQEHKPSSYPSIQTEYVPPPICPIIPNILVLRLLVFKQSHFYPALTLPGIQKRWGETAGFTLMHDQPVAVPSDFLWGDTAAVLIVNTHSHTALSIVGTRLPMRNWIHCVPTTCSLNYPLFTMEWVFLPASKVPIKYKNVLTHSGSLFGGYSFSSHWNLQGWEHCLHKTSICHGLGARQLFPVTNILVH